MKQEQLLHAISLFLISILILELPLTALTQPEKDLICFANGVPYASFAYTPIIPHVNETVAFNASASTADGGSIISYEWDFGDSTNGTGVLITKIYTEVGNYTVTLVVTDSEGEKGTASNVIEVFPNVSLDLYTPKGGQGPHQPDGNYTSGEHVELIALLTYNEEPVQNKPVGFEVRDPIGQVVIYRSDLTDANGLATINFTLPFLCPPSSFFGIWSALATSSVAEQNTSDTLIFRVKVEGPYIDVYTQKEPYSGWGQNQSSDAFAPQEEVILYAYASYSCEPQQNLPVVFVVTNPKGEIIADRTAFLNSEGIANTSFRIPWPCENPEETIFGTWRIVARVSILNETAEDTLTFIVDWIIKIVNLETVSTTGDVKTSFARGEHIYFNLTVRNIAFISKKATLTVVIYDAQGVPIGNAILYNLVIPPSTSKYFTIGLQIPKWAYIGVATVYANAYTDLPSLGGTPYCPEISTIFMITA